MLLEEKGKKKTSSVYYGTDAHLLQSGKKKF